VSVNPNSSQYPCAKPRTAARAPLHVAIRLQVVETYRKTFLCWSPSSYSEPFVHVLDAYLLTHTHTHTKSWFNASTTNPPATHKHTCTHDALCCCCELGVVHPGLSSSSSTSPAATAASPFAAAAAAVVVVAAHRPHSSESEAREG